MTNSSSFSVLSYFSFIRKMKEIEREQRDNLRGTSWKWWWKMIEKIKEERWKKGDDEKIEIRKRKKDEDGEVEKKREEKIQLESWMMILLNSLHKEEARRNITSSSSFIIPSFPFLLSFSFAHFPPGEKKYEMFQGIIIT